MIIVIISIYVAIMTLFVLGLAFSAKGN